jgi:hypothetical protein
MISEGHELRVSKDTGTNKTGGLRTEGTGKCQTKDRTNDRRL